jgi:hypothetical protein
MATQGVFDGGEHGLLGGAQTMKQTRHLGLQTSSQVSMAATQQQGNTSASSHSKGEGCQLSYACSYALKVCH